MEGKEIVERGLIAYCIIMFSEHTMLDIVIDENLKQYKKEAERCPNKYKL